MPGKNNILKIPDGELEGSEDSALTEADLRSIIQEEIDIVKNSNPPVESKNSSSGSVKPKYFECTCGAIMPSPIKSVKSPYTCKSCGSVYKREGNEWHLQEIGSDSKRNISESNPIENESFDFFISCQSCGIVLDAKLAEVREDSLSLFGEVYNFKICPGCSQAILVYNKKKSGWRRITKKESDADRILDNVKADIIYSEDLSKRKVEDELRFW